MEADDVVSLISTADGHTMARVRHAQPVSRVFFNTEVSLLATKNRKGTVRLIDTATGIEVAKHMPHGGASAAAFSSDGKYLAFATKNGIRIYPSNPDNLFSLICEKAGQNLSKADWGDYIDPNEPWRPTCPYWRNPETTTVDLLTK
ncbi:MAG: WD40 repeat domain-containing protein [bacterium]|nr:WD40 repeat domain-containing protein [bacterium]